ncbi:MAG TPA: tail fiber protein [Saprospiraceae bacterium]|nr:phage tail protein [Lewinellaceae bacterium]HQU60560.1 tail fiber protein [Saprospiraceae bacterium]
MEPFLGMIVMFGGNFAPRSWAFCDGQLLSISANTALFSILGTTYGGDGRTTFGLPDLRGRTPMHPGDGPGLTSRRLGERGGEERHTLNLNEIPSHNHPASIHVSNEDAHTTEPTGKVLSVSAANVYSGNAPDGAMAGSAASIGNAGGNQPHNNVQPFQCVNFIIALQGIFPSRS